MAKSLRSKVKRYWRTKRQEKLQKVVDARQAVVYEKLEQIMKAPKPERPHKEDQDDEAMRDAAGAGGAGGAGGADEAEDAPRKSKKMRKGDGRATRKSGKVQDAIAMVLDEDEDAEHPASRMSRKSHGIRKKGRSKSRTAGRKKKIWF